MSDNLVKRDALINDIYEINPDVREGLIKRFNEIIEILSNADSIDAKKFEPFHKHKPFIEILPLSIQKQLRDGEQTIDISRDDSFVLDIMDEIEFRGNSKQRRDRRIVSNANEVALSHTDPITDIDDNDNINESVFEVRKEPNPDDIYLVKSQVHRDDIEDEKQSNSFKPFEKREKKLKSKLRADAAIFKPFKRQLLAVAEDVEESDVHAICVDVYHHFKLFKSQIDESTFMDCIMNDIISIRELVATKKRKLFANSLHGQIGGPIRTYYLIYDYIADGLQVVTNIESFIPKEPGLKGNVYVSKDFTHDLAEYMEEQKWIDDPGSLYKYLHYSFKVFDKLNIKLSFSNGDERIIFPSRLQRPTDGKYLYIIIVPNDADDVKAQWRVPDGAIGNCCLSANELIKKYQLKEYDLPHQKPLPSDGQILDVSYGMEVDMRSLFNKCVKRINKELMDNGVEIENKGELYDAFDCAFRHLYDESGVKCSARLAVPQLFVDKEDYRKELLLPLKVRYPKGSKDYHTFALALKLVKKEKKYKGVSILTLDMGYQNARLIGYVDSVWLTRNARHRM